MDPLSGLASATWGAPVTTLLGVVLGLAVGLGLGVVLGRARGRVQGAALAGKLTMALAERDGFRQEAEASRSLAGLVGPLQDSVDQLRRSAEESNLHRAAAEAALRTHLEQVASRYDSLETATRQIAGALARGQTRGQWGEMQLEQLFGHAGLIEGTHYRRQQGHQTDGARLRPDLIVTMPGGGEIVIDAKFPFDAYWSAVSSPDPVQRDDAFRKHAADLLSRARELATKRYADSTRSPDFVVMFLPLESLLSAALDANGLLLEQTFARRVILATPTTMLALLRTVSFAYDRKLMADNAEEIREAGAEMVTRLAILAEHLDGMRRGLAQAVAGYNDFVGSFERNALSQARRMSKLGVSTQRSLDQPAEIAEVPRVPGVGVRN